MVELTYPSKVTKPTAQGTNGNSKLPAYRSCTTGPTPGPAMPSRKEGPTLDLPPALKPGENSL